MGRLWSARDVANYLGTTPHYVYRLFSDGSIPSFKMRGKRVAHESDVMKFIASCRNKVA